MAKITVLLLKSDRGLPLCKPDLFWEFGGISFAQYFDLLLLDPIFIIHLYKKGLL